MDVAGSGNLVIGSEKLVDNVLTIGGKTPAGCVGICWTMMVYNESTIRDS